MKENQRREEAELKAALEMSKASKADEDRRLSPENGKEKQGGGLSRLKRGSKSLSHRLGKDKETRSVSSDLPPVPIPEHSTLSQSGPISEQQQQQRQQSPPNHAQAPNSPPLGKPTIREDEQVNHKDSKHERTGHGKWRSFSLRKKSFSILS
jgi:ubiquitin carboxyl-terminal hydrolase 9/13